MARGRFFVSICFACGCDQLPWPGKPVLPPALFRFGPLVPCLNQVTRDDACNGLTLFDGRRRIELGWFNLRLCQMERRGQQLRRLHVQHQLLHLPVGGSTTAVSNTAAGQAAREPALGCDEFKWSLTPTLCWAGLSGPPPHSPGPGRGRRPTPRAPSRQLERPPSPGRNRWRRASFAGASGCLCARAAAGRWKSRWVKRWFSTGLFWNAPQGKKDYFLSQ